MNPAPHQAPSHAHLIPIDQIVTMLAGRIEPLVRELLPAGRRSGSEWCVGSLAGEPGTQCAVHLGGAKSGIWKDFRAGIGGDALDLVAQTLFRGDKKQAIAWSKSWLGLDDQDPARLRTARLQAERAQAKRDEQAEADAKRTRNQAFRIWLEGQAQLRGTPVEYYLAGRGIDLSVLGRCPGAIRYHPALWCAERGAVLPAMVTAINGPGGYFQACHRTWLEQAGPGDWRKARLENAKKVLGSFQTAHIAIWRGESGRRLACAPPGEIVDITEGVEDGLSVATALPECRVIAAISLSNLGNLVLPEQLKTLRIWRQADTHPSAIAAYQRAIERLMARGYTILEPPLPDGVGDVNDLLNAEPG